MSFFLICPILITCILLPANHCLGAENSELKEMIDSQGNVYRVDEQGKIYTDGIPHSSRQPATVENIAYYFNQSLTLEANGFLEEAIKMYYEILCLPKVNQSVMNARHFISLRIKKLYNVETNKDVIMKYFNVKRLGEGSLIQYVNKNFHFSFRYPSSWKISKEVMEDKQRNVAYVSLVAPALLDNEGNSVDVSMGLLAENISAKVKSSEYADKWYKKMPSYLRTDITVLDSGRIKNKFTVNFKGHNYYGEEVFWVDSGIGYYLAFTAGPLFLYEITKEYFYQILNTVKLE